LREYISQTGFAVRMEAGKEKISVLKIICWSMDVDEGQGSNRGQLGITWT
jgi:hypothetical protein